ncbi:MAG: hypothetical protein IJL85_00565 [Erysipelotrichaceae bacterium]|nr:hypothetical protein [Erysipelotrichaceae bacterium]
MKSKIDGLKPMGGGVYEDSKDRMYVGDKKKKILYAVDRNSQKKLYLYQQRYSIPLIILVMVGFYFSWYAAVPLALLALAIFEYLYRRFLNTLTAYENIDIPKNLSLRDKQETTETRKLILVVCLSLLLGVLLIVNLLQTVTDWSTAFSDTNTILLILVTIVMDAYIIYFLFNGLSVLLERKKS